MKKIKISAVILALAVAVAFTPSITFAKTNTTLSAPSVRALTNSGSSIQLSWSRVPSASGYLIYRSGKKNGNYIKICKTNDTICTWLNTRLKENTKYYYKVKAFVKSGRKTSSSEFSDPVCGYATSDPYITSGFSLSDDDTGLTELTVKLTNNTTHPIVIDGTEAEYYCIEEDDDEDEDEDEIDSEDETAEDEDEDEIIGDEEDSGGSFCLSACVPAAKSLETLTVEAGRTVTLTWKTSDCVDFINDSSCLDIALSFSGSDYTLTVCNNKDYKCISCDDEDESGDDDSE